MAFGARLDAAEPAEPSPDDALRIAALLGVAEGPGLLMVVGPAATNAVMLSGMIEAIEVIAVSAAFAHSAEHAGVSRISIGTRLPFRSGSMRGIALTGAAALGLLEEAARVVAPRARVVILNAATLGVAARLNGLGLRVIATDDRATVAERASF